MQVKYLQIKEHLLDFIRSGNEGDLLPSEAQLAQKYGVSRITTRKAMEQLEAESLIVRKKGRGTFIRKSTAYTDKIKKLLVVCNLNHLPELSKYVQHILNGCYAGTASNDCVLTMAPSSLGRQALVDLAEQLNIDGIIGITPYEQQNEILEELRMRGFSVLVVNRILRNSHLSYISTDHLQAGALATDFLLERGHHKIGYATIIEGVDYTYQGAEGYEQSMRMGGGVLSEDALVRMSREESFNRPDKVLMEQLERMLKVYKPTALIVDLHGFLPLVLDKIEKLGLKIPEDLEIVVHDLDQIEEFIPQRQVLHELRQPFMEMGKQAIQWMNKYIESGGPRIARILEPELVVKNADSKEKYISRYHEYENIRQTCHTAST